VQSSWKASIVGRLRIQSCSCGPLDSAIANNVRRKHGMCLITSGGCEPDSILGVIALKEGTRVRKKLGRVLLASLRCNPSFPREPYEAGTAQGRESKQSAKWDAVHLEMPSGEQGQQTSA
jgi:hypothetical protein